RVAPRAEHDAGNAAEVDGEALEVDRVGALVDDTEFLLVAKRMALDEGQSVGSGRTFTDLVQLAVLDVAEAQVGVGRKAGAQLLLVEFDADAVESLRKDLPVVIGLAGPGETGGEHGPEVLASRIFVEEMGVVAIVPFRRAQQRELPGAQERNERRQGGVAPQQLLFRRLAGHEHRTAQPRSACAVSRQAADHALSWRAMKALTVSRALSVCGPGSATHSCTEFSNR